ncbi:MAG: PAS domain S-box protein [Bacillota bacterium]|nr:PAS domain S-box protein [Bacillota bacterium]
MATLQSRFTTYALGLVTLVAGIYLGQLAEIRSSVVGAGVALMCLVAAALLTIHLPRRAGDLEEKYRNMIDRLDAIIDASPLAILSLDASGNITWWSVAAERIFKWSAEEVLGGQDPGIPEGQKAGLHDLRQRTIRGELAGGVEAIRRRKDSSEFFAQVRAAPIHGRTGEVIGMVGVIADVSDQKKAEHALRASAERFRRLADNARDIIFTFRKDPDWRVEYTSPAVCTILGYEPDELIGQPLVLRRLCERADLAELLKAVSTCRESQFTFSLRARHKSGRPVWLEAKASKVLDAGGQICAVEGIARDVTEHMRLEEQLRYMSLHDELTGLHNRRHFERELQRAVDEGLYPICVISSDVDGLKLVNDTMGHKQGDQMLVDYANLLETAIDMPAVISRIGGDEFALLLTSTPPEMADEAVARIEGAVERYNSRDPIVPLSVSLGMATTSGPDTALDDLLGQADRNMYREKIHRSTTAAHSIVRSLLAVLTAKDNVAEGHFSRVSRLSQVLGEAAKLSKKDLADLALLAEVHDLGKVSTPDQILFKRGPLTKREREEVEQHSTVGYKIARSSPELSHIAELILHHHEWWNGTGYPLGLSSDAIPVQCRILAIIDAYDAMTNDRPYRKAMTRSAAIQELQRCAGQQFDPLLTDLFVQILAEGGADL